MLQILKACAWLCMKDILKMGNSTNFKQIQKRTIAERDEHLDQFLATFREILKNEKITAQKIDFLTRLDLVGLVAELNKGSVTSEQLVAIYGERAATLGRTNCIITEDYFQYALRRARECDQLRKSTRKRNWTMEDDWDMDKCFPPLFGIPCSIKDNIDMQGTRSTLGATARADHYSNEDCATIKCLKNSGNIPFIKTNLPQLAFSFDSTNYLWGRVLNPWNATKSAGGSSGGEGAAIAGRISPVGVGNDMAGSIRIPAAFNGVYGLCPSADRLPFKGQMCKYSTGFSGLDTVMAVNGPLSKSVDSLALWMRNMTTEEFYLGEHDAYKKLFPFDVKTYKEYSEGKKKLKIGYIESFSLIEPTPAVRRAVTESVAFLKSEGHETVEVAIPNETELIMSLFTELLCEGNMESFKSILEGEDMIEEYSELSMLTSSGCCIYNLIKCVMDKKYPRLGMAIGASKHGSAHDYIENAGRMNEMQLEWIKYWRAQKLDFLVLPGFATEAANHGSGRQGSYLATYTYIFNILKMASCSQPITLTREDERHYESDWQDPVTELIRHNLKDAQGMPVSIQVVGLPFHEEGILGLSKRIEGHFKFTQKHPLPDLK